MRPFVLDASVALDWWVEGTNSPASRKAQEQMIAGARPLVPIFFYHEVANGLVRAARRKHTRVSEAQVADFQSLTELVELGAGLRVLGLIDLAERLGLTVYDAAYLNLAIRHNLPLATLDKGLGKAAQRAGVELLR